MARTLMLLVLFATVAVAGPEVDPHAIDTKPDTRIATPITTANSCSRRPTTPPMKSTGMKTAASDSVIDRIVNATSFDPLNAAVIASSPCSMCRTMFSSMTMASSTTKPTESVNAISERLSML